MATFNKFNAFVEHLAEGVHDFSSHDCYVMLVNTAPVATNVLKADLTEISAGNGYDAGGKLAALSSSAHSSGTYKLVLSDPATWTAAGGSIGPFRYAVLYNQETAALVDPLIGYWDYGSAVTLAAGETFTVDFDGTNGVLQIV
jgi:uncharacterized protein (DUF2252 family)